MTQKAALITGASRGIGYALSETLLELGYDVYMVARDLTRLSGSVSKLQSQFPERKVSFAAGDIADKSFIERFSKEALEFYPYLEVVINNAGSFQGGSTEIAPEIFEQMLDVNLTAPFLVAKAFIPHFQSQKHGYLINVSSLCGVTGFAGIGAYCASKFGLMGLNESLFRELVSQGIKVTALCPSWVNTDMSAGISPFSGDEMIQPKDLGKTVEYLLSLSPYVCPKEIVLECIRSPS